MGRSPDQLPGRGFRGDPGEPTDIEFATFPQLDHSNNRKFTRRDFLRLSGAASAGFVLGACADAANQAATATATVAAIVKVISTPQHPRPDATLPALLTRPHEYVATAVAQQPFVAPEYNGIVIGAIDELPDTAVGYMVDALGISDTSKYIGIDDLTLKEDLLKQAATAQIKIGRTGDATILYRQNEEGTEVYWYSGSPQAGKQLEGASNSIDMVKIPTGFDITARSEGDWTFMWMMDADVKQPVAVWNPVKREWVDLGMGLIKQTKDGKVVEWKEGGWKDVEVPTEVITEVYGDENVSAAKLELDVNGRPILRGALMKATLNEGGTWIVESVFKGSAFDRELQKQAIIRTWGSVEAYKQFIQEKLPTLSSTLGWAKFTASDGRLLDTPRTTQQLALLSGLLNIPVDYSDGSTSDFVSIMLTKIPDSDELVPVLAGMQRNGVWYTAIQFFDKDKWDYSYRIDSAEELENLVRANKGEAISTRVVISWYNAEFMQNTAMNNYPETFKPPEPVKRIITDEHAYTAIFSRDIKNLIKLYKSLGIDFGYDSSQKTPYDFNQPEIGAASLAWLLANRDGRVSSDNRLPFLIASFVYNQESWDLSK